MSFAALKPSFGASGAAAAPSRRIASLDGLRALAVLLVVVDHSVGNFAGGGVGVNVFFVLSGYLITTLLLAERRRTGTVSLKLFYARRALRLYPALLTMLVVTVALGASAKMAAIAATYTTNLYDTFGGDSFSQYAHTWSLALEEQFYLLWPLLLPLAARSRRSAIWLLAAGAAGSVALAWFGTQALVDREGTVTSVVFNPLWQAHGLLIGCALAFFLTRGIPVRRTNGLVIGGTATVLIVAVLASITVERHWAAGWNLAAELAAAAIIAGLARGAQLWGPARIFESRPAVWIGARSYGIYLWHLPLILLTAPVVGVPAAFVAAAVSYRWVEAPFLALKDRMHRTSAPAPVPQTAPAATPRLGSDGEAAVAVAPR